MSTPQQQDRTGNWKIDTVHSHVGFSVKHMVVATFRGRFEEYDGRAHSRRGRRAAARGLGRASTRSSSRTRTSPAT